MTGNTVIEAKNVFKIYELYANKNTILTSLFVPRKKVNRFMALRDISFQIDRGDIVGVVGVNGSGKSTLMQLIAGISWPTSGTLAIEGEVSLLSVGFGLDPQLTGRENIDLKGILLGIPRKTIKSMRNEIIEFADIGNFIDQPMKTYSSGMRSRLGFAISICLNPDILIVDEALAVGDGTFTQKCFDRMSVMQKSGKTIIYVSHSPGTMKSFCNKMMWLHNGYLKQFDLIENVFDKYNEFISNYKNISDAEKKLIKSREEKDRIILHK